MWWWVALQDGPTSPKECGPSCWPLRVALVVHREEPHQHCDSTLKGGDTALRMSPLQLLPASPLLGVDYLCLASVAVKVYQQAEGYPGRRRVYCCLVLPGVTLLQSMSSIEKIEEHSQALLRASLVIPSYDTAVCGLVRNSVDAGATFVSVILEGYDVTVRDNGHGFELTDNVLNPKGTANSAKYSSSSWLTFLQLTRVQQNGVGMGDGNWLQQW